VEAPSLEPSLPCDDGCPPHGLYCPERVYDPVVSWRSPGDHAMDDAWTPATPLGRAGVSGVVDDACHQDIRSGGEVPRGASGDEGAGRGHGEAGAGLRFRQSMREFCHQHSKLLRNAIFPFETDDGTR
jgi:hypothetical protein